jgi:hypothetical protein
LAIVRFWRDCVEEDGELAVRKEIEGTGARVRWCSSGLQSSRQDQLCQLSEVQGNGSQGQLAEGQMDLSA